MVLDYLPNKLALYPWTKTTQIYPETSLCSSQVQLWQRFGAVQGAENLFGSKQDTYTIPSKAQGTRRKRGHKECKSLKTGEKGRDMSFCLNSETAITISRQQLPALGLSTVS